MTTQPDDTNFMLEAIEKLTIPHATRVLQTNDAGISCISDVNHDPLLVTLRDAVAGGTSAHNNSTMGSERIPLNPGAMELFDAIARQVNVWYLAINEPREHLHIHTRLGRWYLNFEDRRRKAKLTASEEHDALKLVEGWARSIEAMFDPPSVLELTQEYREPVMVPKTRVRVVDGERVKEPVTDAAGDVVMVPKLDRLKQPLLRLVKTEPAACPNCGERYAHDPKSGDQISALILEYRELGPETFDHATGLCRFCSEVWRGGSRVRELRWLIDHADDTPNEVDTETATEAS